MDSSSPSTGPAESVGAFANPDVQERLIDLSKSFIYHTFDGEADACASLFAPNALWLSPFQDDDAGDVEAFRRFCNIFRDEGYRVILAHQSFEFHAQCPNCCLVIARAFVYIGIGGLAPILSQPLRLVLHWQLQPTGSIRIICLDGSLLMDAQGLERNAGGEEDIKLPKNQWDQRLELRDDHGVTHFVDREDILYVEAQGRKTIIHCLDENLVIQEGIGNLETVLGSQFVRLHRTYLVNGWQVKSLSARGAVMTDGSVLPVPARRLVALREEINDVRKPRQLSLSDLEKAVQAAITDGESHGNIDGTSAH